MNKILKLNDYKNNKDLAIEIINLFSNKYEYIIIKNNLINEDNLEDIMDYYNKLNILIGDVKLVDKNKYADENQDDYWVDVVYNINNKDLNEIPPWKSNEQLLLHTDNTLTNNLNFGNITELVCLKPCDYSGETIIVSNNKIIEIVKYLDKINNSNLYDDLLKTEIYHKSVKKNICIKIEDHYQFNFNIMQILKSKFNNNNSLIIAKEFSKILENIVKSSLVNIIKLEKGDALLLNDTIVMHGRKYVFGDRLCKKCTININNNLS